MSSADHGQAPLSPAIAASVNRAYQRLLRCTGRGQADIHRRVALGRHLMRLAAEGEQDEERFVQQGMRALLAGFGDPAETLPGSGRP